MNRHFDDILERSFSVPRPRGDEPASPRYDPDTPGAFPAHAGMNQPTDEEKAEIERVPRPRGDEPNFAVYNGLMHRRSPPTRG